jgi:hypothetical protein
MANRAKRSQKSVFWAQKVGSGGKIGLAIWDIKKALIPKKNRCSNAIRIFNLTLIF